jgi:hypothetical protein
MELRLFWPKSKTKGREKHQKTARIFSSFDHLIIFTTTKFLFLSQLTKITKKNLKIVLLDKIFDLNF